MEQKTKNNKKNTEKRLVVSQSNTLIQKASTDTNYDRNLTKQSFVLDVYQRRLVALMISHIKPKDDEFPVERISFTNFMKLMDISDGGKQYEKIKASIYKLMGMSFCIEPKPGVFEFYHWIADGATVDENSKEVTLQLSPGIKKFLIGNKRNFTQYELGYILGLKKKYSTRLYEYLHSMLNLPSVNLSVDTFSQNITDSKYKTPTDIKRYVIEPALKEINETSDITVKYDEIRETNMYGKEKTIGYKFWVGEKPYEERQAIMGTWGIDFEDILLLDEKERPSFKDSPF